MLQTLLSAAVMIGALRVKFLGGLQFGPRSDRSKGAVQLGLMVFTFIIKSSLNYILISAEDVKAVKIWFTLVAILFWANC